MMLPFTRALTVGLAMLATTASASAQGTTPAQAPAVRPAATVRITGVVRDETNAITLPGVAVEVIATKQVVYTDIDGRYVVDVPVGEHDIKVTMGGYRERTVRVAASARETTANIALSLTAFAESVTVAATAIDAPTSSAEAQLIERKQAGVISDNIGGQEMKANGDSDAASAMARVTGMSLVDNQFVFVRGLGERYSNTTLSGSVIPTTEPDKKVVPLDLFPSGLLDSIQVAKSYTPDKSSEFAGGLVQITPMKLPTKPLVDFSYNVSSNSQATGKQIPLSPIANRDWLGFDSGTRALPGGFPANKVVRAGIFTPDVGFAPDQISQIGQQIAGGQWRPSFAKGAPGQGWSTAMGNRFGNLGIVASVSQSYKESAVNEQRRFYSVAEGSGSTSTLQTLSDYAMQYGSQRAQLGVVGNVAYQVSGAHRIAVDNFYTHSGKDEGRTFEGYNLDNNRVYRNYRLSFVEEELVSNAVTGDHFFRNLANSRLDWRVTSARATRDEPGLRETLYEYTPPTAAGAATPPFVLADESQSGFQMFNALKDDTLAASVNWSTFFTSARPTQLKFGASYVDRSRDFGSRRFRFIPITLTKDGALQFNNQLAPEDLYVAANIGTAFRFNEETRPSDAYEGAQSTTSVYGMVDVVFTSTARLVAGARVERFEQKVDTLDPFGLFETTLTSENENTDVFPAVNYVQALNALSNLRVSYSTTVNRPEFRELAEFEFTDVVGNRAVIGNPNLKRALIQNVDARWERFTGGRGIVAVSVFYKYFDQPIEQVVLGAAQPIATYQNADSAQNLGFEVEVGRAFGKYLFTSANYTFVDSSITLRPEQVTVQTSNERPLVGQSKNIFNFSLEGTVAGFSARALYNFVDDRISEAGANDAPDMVEEARGTVDVSLQHKLGRFNVRLNLDNLTNTRYRFTQGGLDARTFTLGRTVALSFGVNIF